MRFFCPVQLRAQETQKKSQAILILIFGVLFFNAAPNFDMRPSGPGTVWCLLNLSMARNFFWVRVGLTWNQTGLGAPARTRYEATRDGVRAPQGGPQGSGRCSAQGAPPLCAGWPPGIGSSVNKGYLSYAQPAKGPGPVHVG